MAEHVLPSQCWCGGQRPGVHHEDQEHNRDTGTLTFAITYKLLNVPKLSFCKKTVNQRESHSVIDDLHKLMEDNPKSWFLPALLPPFSANTEIWRMSQRKYNKAAWEG